MGNVCMKCFSSKRKLKRWMKAKYSKHGKNSTEFSSLITDEDKQTSEQKEAVSSLTQSERRMLKDREYDSLIVQQKELEETAARKLAEEEAALQEAEEVARRTRRDAARAAKTRRLWEEEARGDWRVEADQHWTSFVDESSDEAEFGEFLRSVKVSELSAESPKVQNSSSAISVESDTEKSPDAAGTAQQEHADVERQSNVIREVQLPSSNEHHMEPSDRDPIA